MSDLVGNPEDRFSHNEAHLFSSYKEMSINVTAKYVIMTIVCMAYIDVKASHVINDIGSQLCPYTSFCQRNATPFFNPLQLRPCCSDCSCEANCWETANCCPDQDVIEHPEPVANCKTSIVKAGKGFSSDIWGYRVIDYCPTTETNASLVTKCTNEKSRDFVDLIRVSDDISRKVYQNRFCAECHHVTNRITELPLVAQCTEDIYTNEGNWKSFLLSNKCQLTSINTNLATCAVPKYTRCNQTGLWQNFDADVKWACEIFEAVFFLKASQGRNEHTDTYRNAYCYVCNTDSIGSIDALCPGRKFQPPGVTVFSSLIDYKRYQTDVQDTTPLTTCRSHEIMDTIMVCRGSVLLFLLH